MLYIWICLFNQIAGCHRSRAQLLIKLTSLGKKMKLYTKKSGTTHGFTVWFNHLQVAPERTLPFINT